MKERKFLTAFGVNYAGTIGKIGKALDPLRPIYEAITNSFEAISMVADTPFVGKVSIQFIFEHLIVESAKRTLDKIVVRDNGTGFTNKDFERMINLNDTGKGFLNKGSGRVQMLHFFERSEFVSVYKNDDSPTGFSERNFTLSKSKPFLDKNAIMNYTEPFESDNTQIGTTLTFKNPISSKDKMFYEELPIDDLKEKIIKHYLALFCENRSKLPNFLIEYRVEENLIEKQEITENDIPSLDKDSEMKVPYVKIANDGKSVEKTGKFESLRIKAFRINKDKLNRNELLLTSKGEIAKALKLQSVQADDVIEDNRYLFLISGDYINKKDSDTRGEIKIPTLDEYKKMHMDSLYESEELLLEELEERANESVVSMYEEIKKLNENKAAELERLQKMFLLNENTINEVKVKLNDNEERILEKVYQADAKLIAKKDAEIKKHFDDLNSLNPAAENYNETLEKSIDELVKIIPLQNRTALTHYVARRALVLDLMGKIIDQQLTAQKMSSRKVNEKLLHNIIFQQSSTDPSDSDLWLINEEFIYFKGCSEKRLKDIEIDGRKIFKDKFNEEEIKYLTSLGEDRKIKRPDVLLFPEEGKCIIIEFKDPEVNVSEHLTQIDFYSSLIRNFTIDEIQITAFFGYLIGENIENRDVRGRVSRYEFSPHFDYLFRPSEKVIGEDGRSDGSIYSEVIKYSTLLQRAKLRNKIFIDKLTKS